MSPAFPSPSGPPRKLHAVHHCSEPRPTRTRYTPRHRSRNPPHECRCRAIPNCLPGRCRSTDTPRCSASRPVHTRDSVRRSGRRAQRSRRFRPGPNRRPRPYRSRGTPRCSASRPARKPELARRIRDQPSRLQPRRVRTLRLRTSRHSPSRGPNKRGPRRASETLPRPKPARELRGETRTRCTLNPSRITPSGRSVARSPADSIVQKADGCVSTGGPVMPKRQLLRGRALGLRPRRA